MKDLLLLDAGNYDGISVEIRRTAVRGVIFISGLLLLNESSDGLLKLPGGGRERGERDADTLIREVREETGYRVIPDSIREFGQIEEIRRADRRERIWHQFNRLYFCEVDPVPGETAYSESEKKRGFRVCLLRLDDAIERIHSHPSFSKKQDWNLREYRTLLLVREEILEGRLSPKNWASFQAGV